MQWEHDEDGRHMIKEEKAGIIVIESQTDKSIPIKQKSAHESHKALGCIKNPTMIIKDQVAELRKKAERISQLT